MRNSNTLLASLAFLITVQMTAMAQSCPQVLIFTSNEITDTSIVLRWFSLNEPEVAYQVDIKPRGLPPSDSARLVPPMQDRDSLNSLLPQTAYTAYIRSICLQDTSPWKAFDFFTALNNGSACNLEIPLLDDNCRTGLQRIPIYVDDYPGDSLGQQVQLTGIQLIIQHPYPADLKLQLVNPSGKRIILVENHGTFTDNFGVPGDSSCIQASKFTRTSCQSIYSAQPPFLGEYQSDAPIDQLNDASPANGKWLLEVCDKAADDVGVLKHIYLDFSQNVCPTPPQLSARSYSDTIQELNYRPSEADSLLVLYSLDPQGPVSINDSSFLSSIANPRDSILILRGLTLNSKYYAWTFLYCNGEWIGPSCPAEFQTAPALIGHYSDWETEDLCSGHCQVPCSIVDEFWFNSGSAWNIISGPTSTPFTGPDRDVFFNGKYIYKEASQTACLHEESTLQSICLKNDTSSGYTGFSFFYHMEGSDVGSLKVLISPDEWTTADTLWKAEGSQGEDWILQHILVPDTFTGPFQIRFTGLGAEGAFGDIALGDIAFMGISPVPLNDQLTYPDRDRDGYGNGDTVIFYCGMLLPDSLTLISGDCRDGDQSVYPTATDKACNGIDEDCDGSDNYGGADALTVFVDTMGPPTCPLDQNGFIQIAIEGGSPPYSIQWSTGDSTLYMDSLSSGKYTVRVSDSLSCQSTSLDIELNSAHPVSFSFNILQRPSCPQPSTGSVMVNVSGGTPPYDIYWSNGENGQIADSISQGPFHVIVIDSLKCQYYSDTFSLTATKAYDIEIVKLREISCPSGTDGSLRVIAPGSVPPLTYEWSTGDTTATISGLAAGSYTAKVTDAQGCTINSSPVVLSPPLPIEINNLLIDAQQCSGLADASISTQAIGGNPPYAYRWLGPENKVYTGQMLRNILPGYYKLTVTDSKGCSLIKDSIYIEKQDPVRVEKLKIQRTKCPLSKDGHISFDIEGGKSPYQIAWSDGVRNEVNRDSLKAGTYGLTITDELSCKKVFNSLRVPKGDSSLQIEMKVIDSLFCSPNDRAEIRALCLNGDPPFRFNWSAGIQHTTSRPADTLEGLTEGNYNVTVTDGTGCVGVSGQLNIESYAPININDIEIHQPKCAGENTGQIEFDASSPNGKLTYSWSNFNDFCCLDSLTAGNYHLTISDPSGCIPRTYSFTLTAPEPIETNVDTFYEGSSICFQLQSIMGGVAPYRIHWLYNDSFVEGHLLCVDTGLAPNIILEVSDSNNCILSKIIIDKTTSVNGANYAEIEVYPNPFSDRFHVNNSSANSRRVILWDNKGTMIFERKLSSGINSFEMQGLPKGTYLLTIESVKGGWEKYLMIHH